MEALMVGGPRHGHMVTVSAHDATQVGVVADDDVWPPVWVDVARAHTYRRFPIHYGEPSALVRGRIAARWDAVVYLSENVTTDQQMAQAFPNATTLWWFRTTGIKTTPDGPRPFADADGETEQNGDTPA